MQWCIYVCVHQYSSVIQSSRSVVSDSLWPHGLQHTRPPCPSPTPGVYPNSCPSCRWCHPTISSSVVPFSSCLQSFPASGSFHYICLPKHENINIYLDHNKWGNYTKYNTSKFQNEKKKNLDGVRIMVRQFHLISNTIKIMVGLLMREEFIFYFFSGLSRKSITCNANFSNKF